MNEYKKQIAQLHFTQEQKDAMTEHLMNAQHKQPKNRRAPWKRAAILAAAAAVTLSIGVGAQRLAGDIFADLFGTEHTEVINKIGRPVDASAADNGVRITANAVIGDRYHYAVIFDVEKEDGTAFDARLEADQNGVLPLIFEQSDINFNMREGFFGDCYFYDADPSDNVVQFVQTGEVSREIIGKNVSAKFKDLCVLGKDGRDKLLIKGEWNMNFRMDFKDSSVQLKSGAHFSADGKDASVDAVTISPLAVRVEFTVYAPEFGEEEWENVELSVILKDGTEISMDYAGGGIHSAPEGQRACDIGGMFEKIIPLDEMDSVIVGGVRIPVTE